MSEIADRYRRVSGRFTERAAEVPDRAWENAAPCEGWVARDVVRHMVDWMPSFFVSGGGPRLPVGPSVDDDPVGAWTVMSDGIQALLDDPAAAVSEITHPQAGTHPLMVREVSSLAIPGPTTLRRRATSRRDRR